jgi:inhibitor of KinA sporulation pathway (predicted exonuclease)
MNYIVLDLEWNQSPVGKVGEQEGLPFEILEIGAVKLDENLEYADSYQGIVRPQVYRDIHFETQKILQKGLSEYLHTGRIFSVVVKEFLKWCGEEPLFCTWGSLDLMELQRNMKYYGLSYLMKGPIKYYDVQKLFSYAFEDRKIRRALDFAVGYLHIPEEEPFHRALYDALYTARVLQKIDMKQFGLFYSIDTYEPPRTQEEEIYAYYDNYSKYISRAFPVREEAMADRTVNSCKCCICGRNLRKKIRWFSVQSGSYLNLSACFRHGYVRGKLKFKKTDEGTWYAVKIMKRISREEAAGVREKQEQIRRKRREKRQVKNCSLEEELK